jgi:hypothetical protein
MLCIDFTKGVLHLFTNFAHAKNFAKRAANARISYT